MDTNGNRVGRRVAMLALLIGLLAVLAGCTGATSNAQSWTLGPTLAPPVAAASVGASPAAPTPAVVTTPDASAASVDGTPKPFSGRMTPHVLLVDGYVTMYMELDNTGSEPLTFINTLYDLEPT